MNVTAAVLSLILTALIAGVAFLLSEWRDNRPAERVRREIRDANDRIHAEFRNAQRQMYDATRMRRRY